MKLLKKRPDWEDRLGKSSDAVRGRQPNVSFFAYTATPKGKTLELFGRDRIIWKARTFSPIQHAPGYRGEFHS